MQTNELDAYLAEHPETTHLDILVIDLCGNAVGKRLPVDTMRTVFAQGSPMCAAMQLVDIMGNTSDPMGYGFSDGDPDALAVPVAGTLKPVPWLKEGKTQVLCELRDAGDGKPLWYEPRQVLRKVVERFEEMGITPCLAVELEFYLLDIARDDSGNPVPATSPATGMVESTGKVLSLDKLDEFSTVLEAIEATCKAQDIPTTTMISEYGAGQFEVNLQHRADALQAADHAALLRRAVKGVSRQHGFEASFMSKPFADQSGSGMHIHLSLLDADGNNLFDDSREDGEEKLRHAVAGMQALMGESMAIFAPNLNVYRRFQPDQFVPVTTDWGANNRSVAFRVPASDGANRRIEHRVSGAEANPYLVIAAVLAGVHHGLSRKLDPGNMHGGNAGAEVDPSLPLELWRALDATRNANVLKDYLGEDYLEIYTEVKRAEMAAFMDSLLRSECDWYL